MTERIREGKRRAPKRIEISAKPGTLASMKSDSHERYMRMALREAKQAAREGEVPVGAVIVRRGALLGKAHNQVEQLRDPTAHAEMIAITQAASALKDWRLADCALYVTKEPCVMCAGAIILARLPQVVWGVADPLRGGAVSRFQVLQHESMNHRSDVVSGILEAECRELLQDFFQKRRKPSDPAGE